jgi:hypothetical protein
MYSFPKIEERSGRHLDAFDELGFPVQRTARASLSRPCTSAACTLLRKRKSSLLVGVGEDGAIVANKVARRWPTERD